MKGKSRKKVITILIAFILLFSFTATAYASEKTTLSNNDNIYSNILNALNCLDRNLYGLEDIDFEQITVGDAINSYEYANDSLNTLHYKIYPLTYDENLIAFAIKYDTLEAIQITTDMVDEISSNIDSSTSFALVYDANSCYAYTDDGLTSLCETVKKPDNRNDINNTSDESFLEKTDRNTYAQEESLDNSGTLGSATSSTSILSAAYTAATTSYVSCSVSYVTQNPPSNYCWASSVACIGNYITGKSLTGKNVATSLYGSDYDKGASNDAAMVVMNNLYDTTYTYHSSVPSDSVIYNKIVSDKPLYSCWSWSGGNHATVIYGINITAGYIYIMDPEYGFESAVTTGSTYKFTSLYSGVTCTLKGYGV